MAKKQIATFLGANKGLSIAGDQAYAFSGSITDANSQKTMLDFVTPKAYIVGKFVFFGSTVVDQSAGGLSAGNICNFQILFNGSVIAVGKTDTQAETMPSYIEYDTILPPLTQVIVKVVSSGTAADYSTSMSFIGRVYA